MRPSADGLDKTWWAIERYAHLLRRAEEVMRRSQRTLEMYKQKQTVELPPLLGAAQSESGSSGLR